MRTDHYIYLYREFLGDPDLNDGNPRDTEDSRTVVRYWFNPNARYAAEEIPDPRCLRIVAERLLVRRLLGIAKMDAGYEKCVAKCEVFGRDKPFYSELVSPKVFVAMAFFPLTPQSDNGVPRLARLYCVDGLSAHYYLPLDGMEEPNLLGYSWFLEGVPTGERDGRIVGRSWLLAAHLLAHIVAKRDISMAQKLAKEFIVTGDVKEGKVLPVEMGRKEELKDFFKNYKWMIPMGNEMKISKLMIRKPATIEEAQRMLVGIGSASTASLSSIVRSPNVSVDSCLGPLRGLADPHAPVLNGMNALQHLEDSGAGSIFQMLKELGVATEGKIDKNWFRAWEDRLCRVLGAQIDVGRVMSYYGSVPQMFFTAARLGDVALLQSLLSAGLNIDASDAEGMTALDFALEVAHDSEAAALLRSVGAKRRGMYEIGSSWLTDALRDVGRQSGNVLMKKRVVMALKNGLSPNAVHVFSDDLCFQVYNGVRWEDVGDGKEVACQDPYSPYPQPFGEEQETTRVFDRVSYAGEYRVYSWTPYFVALFSGDADLIALCEEKDADVESRICVSEIVEKIKEESFEASGKKSIEHEVKWADDDFAPHNRNEMSIAELVSAGFLSSAVARESVARVRANKRNSQNK